MLRWVVYAGITEQLALRSGFDDIAGMAGTVCRLFLANFEPQNSV